MAPLTIDIGLSWITAVLLCTLRLSAMLLMTPILRGFGIPPRIRMFVVIAFALILISALPYHMAPVSLEQPTGFLMAAASELLTGALMGFGAICAFGVFSFAGNLLDQQWGFGLASVFDPMIRHQNPMIASIMDLLAIVLFFTTNAHHMLLRGFAWSLEKVPLGSLSPSVSTATLVHQFGLIFSNGLLLVAPVLFSVFLIDIGLAVISRNLPQFNIFMIGMPVKIIAGLLILIWLMPHMTELFTRIYGSIFEFWQETL